MEFSRDNNVEFLNLKIEIHITQNRWKVCNFDQGGVWDKTALLVNISHCYLWLSKCRKL